MKIINPLRPIAEAAHSLFCNYNHTDGCGWGYETSSYRLPSEEDLTDAEVKEITWGKQAHVRWLDKVDDYLKENSALSPSNLLAILCKFQGLKDECPRIMDIIRQLQRL